MEFETTYNWIVYDSAPIYNAEYVDKIVARLTADTYQNIDAHDYDADLVINEILKIIWQVCKDIESNKFKTVANYLPTKGKIQ